MRARKKKVGFFFCTAYKNKKMPEDSNTNDNNKRPLEDNNAVDGESGNWGVFLRIDFSFDAYLIKIDDDIGPMLPPPPGEDAPRKKKRSKREQIKWNVRVS
jgi:hypothetical protein